MSSDTRDPVVILGLPPALATIPPDPSGPDDPDRVAKRQAWHEWSVRILQYRVDTLQRVRDYREFEEIERRKCQMDKLYLMTVYGYLFEPRAHGRRGGYIPWIPFERQAQLVRFYDWVKTQQDENADAVVSKSRDMGASWTIAYCILADWLFTPNFQALCMSWKEEYVDSRKPRALFWKMDQVLKYLPSFLRPRGFSASRHRMKLFFHNPENGNTISGESTTSKSGRGDRATVAFPDEAAQIPGLLDVWTGLTDVADHRFLVSTESMDQGDDFYNLSHGIDMEFRPALFTMDWWENPLHDDDWYDRQQRRYAADPDGWEREIMRNPLTTSQYVYPTAREKMPVPELLFFRGNPLEVGIDPGFEDAFAMVVIQQNVADGWYDVLGGYTNNKQEAAFYGPIITGSLVDLSGKPIMGDWEYTPYDEEIISWMADLTDGAKTLPIYYGDTYGDNRQGASADSWYSVWRRNHGVRVNADRLPNGKVAAYRMQARTHVGRRKAMRWIMPRLRFGDSIGARQALVALQNNRLPEPSRSGKIPEHGMLRDKTTHYTSALEYWAVNRQMKDYLTQDALAREAHMKEAAEIEIASGPRFGRGRHLREIA